ncbi:MAG: zf-TFIIB domain-containing protein [Candidatus Pacebacteria bacterium]|nr:zf-TFIIB domain-containing protein [Candidatus Paceibacterota bacterium]
MKNCPSCNQKLKEISFYGVKIDYCEQCKGIWFEKEELDRAKDLKQETINWLDVDLWDKTERFKMSKKERQCPECKLSLYEVNYDDSEIKVDVCSICEGVWLDKGEFNKVMDYLKDKSGDEIINNYGNLLLEETREVFIGPEPLKEELKDLFVLLGLFKYRFVGKHPFLADLISKLPKA